MKFIGRIEEIKRINKLINEPKQNNILIYGRRRIGKSFLIKKALENYNGLVIHYQCKDINYSNTLEELSLLIKTKMNLQYEINFKTIDLILDFLFKQEKDIVFVLDEYSYLCNKIEGLDSIIQNKIDTYKYDSKLKIILSGSQIEIMKNMIEYGNPLYGRFTDIIELKEHNYLESSEYYPSFSNEDKVMLYSVFGGEPLYNSLIDESKSALDNIKELIIKENSFVELNINNMLNAELSKIKLGNDVLQAIALGVRKNDDLVSKARAENSAALNHVLKKLLKLDLIKKISPINDENNKKKTMYFINNNPLRFYYKYLYRYSNERSNMFIDDFYNQFISDDFNTQYIPNIFEDITKQYLIIQNKERKIDPPFNKIGTYWYDDKVNKTNGQFDVVTFDKNGYIFYEVKYIDNKISKSIVEEEKRQLSLIEIPYYNLGFVSKKGFDNIKDNYILISLDDIYKN